MSKVLKRRKGVHCEKCRERGDVVVQDLRYQSLFSGEIFIPNVEYDWCPSCKIPIAFPYETCRLMDKEEQRIIDEYLLTQPLGAFMNEEEVRIALKIPMGDFWRHKDIYRGFIFHTDMKLRTIRPTTLFLTRSVELYKKTKKKTGRGDGRFDVTKKVSTECAHSCEAYIPLKLNWQKGLKGRWYVKQKGIDARVTASSFYVYVGEFCVPLDQGYKSVRNAKRGIERAVNRIRKALG